MCDCGCFTPADDNGSYEPSTFDITGNPIDVPGYQPAPAEPAPIEPAPVAVGPSGYDPGASPNAALIDALQMAPAGSAEAGTLLSVINTQNHLPDIWLQPSHDIYGNPL